MEGPSVEIIDTSLNESATGEVANNIINGTSVHVVYDLKTLAIVNMVTMRATDSSGDDSSDVIFTPVAGEGHGMFIAEHMLTTSVFASDNYCDPITGIVYMKPVFSIAVDNEAPIMGDTVEATVELRDYKGVSLEGTWSGTVKIKDRLRFCALSATTIEWPSVKTFKFRSPTSGQAAIRVKDTACGFVPGVEVITFAPEPF